MSDVEDGIDPNAIPAASARAVLEFLARSVVEDPDAVEIDVEEGRRGPALNVRVGPGDMGRVIGKRGRVAQSIRTVVRAAAVKDGVSVDVEFLDQVVPLDAPRLLEVGRIDRPHGIRGEVVVTLVTDRVERLDHGSVLHTPERTLVVQSAKPFRHRWIVEFAGVASREAAEALHGTVLSAEPVEDPDVLWVHELIGSEVVTPDGRSWGRVRSVHDVPASDLLELDDGSLVPVVFVVDHGPGRVVVDPPVGLLGDESG